MMGGFLGGLAAGEEEANKSVRELLEAVHRLADLRVTLLSVSQEQWELMLNDHLDAVIGAAAKIEPYEPKGYGTT
jgi:hypothetical protein